MKNLIVLIGLIIGLSSFQQPSAGINSLPKGVIIGWGIKTPIPRGWAVCNGANGTPDLVGRFPLGTANSAEINTQTGQSEHTHIVKGTTGGAAHLVANGAHNAFCTSEGDRSLHDHDFLTTSLPASSIPPATKIIFIMKIK